MSRKRPHQRDNAVCRAAVHKIIVFILGNFRSKLHTVCRTVKLGRGIIVPKQTPALDTLQHILKVLKIRLFHQNVRVPAAEFAVLNSAESVDLLVLFEEETLSEFVGVALHRAGAVFEGEGFFRQEKFALGVVETERKGLRIEFDREFRALYGVGLGGQLDVLRLGSNDKALRRDFLANGKLRHADNLVGVKLHVDYILSRLKFHGTGGGGCNCHQHRHQKHLYSFHNRKFYVWVKNHFSVQR